ncbi:hypothetical protein Tco_1105209 [Tanacetum coccineum]
MGVLAGQYDCVLAAMAGHDRMLYKMRLLYVFYGDDDNRFSTAWDALSTASWHDDHTHVVVAAMSSVLYHPVFAAIGFVTVTRADVKKMPSN